MLGILLALPLPVYASVQKDGVHITVLHTNDMHARVQNTDDEGKTIGLDWLAGAIWAQKEADEDTLALDAGDTFHGTTLINISRGSNMAMLMNLSGYDAMTPGNHDFNFGSQRLVELARMLNFPVLSANLLDKDQKQYIFRPYKSYEFNGVKVAVVGLTTPETAYKTNPLNVQEVSFTNPIDAAKSLVPKLRATHDVVIGLMHMGIDKSSVMTSEQIAKAVPGFDLVIDGHSHSVLPKGLKVGKTLICQTGWHGYALGRVELVVKDHKLRKVQASLLDREGVEKLAQKPDEGVAQALQEINLQVEKEKNTLVAESPRELSAERKLVRTGESELGNLTADAIRQASGADVALVNGGSLRHSLPQGQVTRGAVLDIFPFNNRVVTLVVDGKTLKSALELSVQHLPETYGGFLCVSGMSFTVDAKAPQGKRVSEVKVQGNPLVEEKNYTVATNDFILAGGDGYTMLKMKAAGDYGPVEDVFSNYLRTNGLQGIEVGRITMK